MMKGIIERITLKNFMTFEDVEVKPHKNLNVIIGPNGSGKSTIVSAIILGLGGKLKLADRGSSLASYIKIGCKEAKIEIELRTGTTSTTVISRMFNLDNKCVWRIDGKVVSSKQVDDKVAEYNIQIGNLCQFLPQEKVTDFAKMNPQVLLENTEKSVGGEKKLAQMHEQLKCLTKEIKEYEKKINEYQAAVENDEQTNSRLAVTVNNIKERMACIEAVKLLKKKRVWAVYKAHKVHTEQKQKEMAEAVADLQRCKKEFEPFESLLDGANKRLQTAQSKLNTCKIRTRDKINTLKNESVSREPVSERIEYVNQEYKKKIEAEKSRESELAALQLQLNKMQNDLRELSKQSDDSTHTQLKEVQEQVSKVSDSCNIFRHKCEDYKSKVSYIDHEIRAQDSELQRLRNVANQRLSLLQHRHPDVYRGTMWLRENKHRFSGNVYDPIVLETNLKDPSYAKYVEAVISNRDLLAFTFEDKDDMNNAMRILRDEMNLRLNFLHSGEMHQPSSHYKSTIPIKHLREFGFKTYISDVIEAPEAILKYLLRTYGLHNIPIGTKQTDATFEKVPASIRLFFSESSRYSASHSIYSGEKLTENSRVTEANYFTRSISIKEIQVIEERKEKLLQEKQQISHDHHTVVQQLMHQESKLKELVNKRKQIQEIVQNRQALGARIKIKQNHINSLEKNKINIKEEEEKFKKTVKKIILDAFDSESKSHETLKEYVELMNNLRLLQYETEDTAAEVERYQHDAQEIKQKCLELENTVRKLKGELSELQTQQKQLLRDAEKAIADVKGNKDTFRNVQQTVQDLDKKIQTEQAKADFIGDVDTGVIAEFEARGKKIIEGKSKVSTMRDNLQRLQAGLERCRNDWLTPLQELVAKINNNFGRCFEEMGCAGEVLLSMGEDQNDYDQYGLHIRVKYRDGEQLRELSQNLQSGGERSVATAIYMIALQELTFVPFRCVDEINQGMDPRNERAVFNFLVKAATRPDTSQYFLLTPKLLPDLEYHDNIKIIIVNNGNIANNYQLWRCKDFRNPDKRRRV
ncbi:structural maintenance of chromosomes protein 5 [Schistocerca piceifrons]|uniref:structural maintenance of chromosomes protein 5 n=1 Tax=Schistocerca piceifrons TaxID=274613 RepID=UPI001F5EF6D5|nr:structural maintenance of chromosomes protein 5 [Schistocerca piceifrons]